MKVKLTRVEIVDVNFPGDFVFDDVCDAFQNEILDSQDCEMEFSDDKGGTFTPRTLVEFKCELEMD